MTLWAIVPAAGCGRRMQSATPKQYLSLANRPVLLHTLLRLQAVSAIRATMLVLDSDDAYWPALRQQLDCSAHPLHQCAGGSERLYSVLNGLRALQGLEFGPAADDWILVHDAARPAVRVSDIDRLLAQIADDAVGGLLALPVADTLKQADDSQQYAARTLDRSLLWQAQTPQIFRFRLLLEVLQQAVAEHWVVTDEASAMEQAGYRPRLVAGSADNIKLTLPRDLDLLAAILQAQHNEQQAPQRS